MQPDSGGLVRETFAKKFYGREPDQAVITKHATQLDAGLKHLETMLFEKSPNFGREGHLTFVDILLGIYFSQLSIIKFDFTPYPKFTTYYNNLKQLPAFVKSHHEFFALVEKLSS